MAGYQVALILFGMYLQAMLRYMATGEIKQHGRLAQGTLYLMLLLQLIYAGLTFQETYISGGACRQSPSVALRTVSVLTSRGAHSQ